MKEFEICRQRTPEEDAFVIDAEWRLNGRPDEAEVRQLEAELREIFQRYTWLGPMMGDEL